MDKDSRVRDTFGSHVGAQAAVPGLHHGRVLAYAGDVPVLRNPDRTKLHVCGVGHRGHEVVGLDKSHDMVRKAKREHPALRFVEGDVVDMVFDAPFDAVFSNAALHWMQPPELVAARIAGALVHGGRFVAEFGGSGNVQALVSGLYLGFEANGLEVPADRNPWYYPSIGEYASLLESQGFDVTAARLFDRPTPLKGGEAGLAGWYEMFAAPFFEGVTAAQKRDILTYAGFVLRDSLFINGVWYADYRRLRVHARKA